MPNRQSQGLEKFPIIGKPSSHGDWGSELKPLPIALDDVPKQKEGRPVRSSANALFETDASAGNPCVGTVLLVEDNEVNRDMLSRRLERSGWIVEVAINGVQGLERARRGGLDLILMDMSLPEMDGWTVTRRLKDNESTRKIPVIALTAHAMNGDREKAINAGCDEFETKPVEYARLLGKMTGLVIQKGVVDGSYK